MAILPPEPPYGWEERAACLGRNPSAFFAEEGVFYDSLGWKSVCPGCPVREACLVAAIRGGENWGVWGGLSPNARFNLARLLADGSVSWEQVVATFHGKS